MRPALVIPMSGMGDTIYQRPFIRAEAKRRGGVYVQTPFSDLFADMPDVTPCTEHTRPENCVFVNLRYGLRWPGDTIVGDLEGFLPLDGEPFDFDLPDFGPSRVTSDKPIAVVRPVTVRRSWLNPARNPLPEYVNAAARWLMANGYHVVSVGKVDEFEEWAPDGLPPAHERYEAGELSIPDLMALVQNADLVVGGIGWIVPACIAAGTPLVAVGGGNGAHNNPEAITDPRMDLSRAAFILPEPYCRCTEVFHDCPREIPGFMDQFTEAVARVAPVAA